MISGLMPKDEFQRLGLDLGEDVEQKIDSATTRIGGSSKRL